MNRRLEAVLDAKEARSLPNECLAATGLIRAQRAAVEDLLNPVDQAPPRVYGFNTLLGHLDHLDTERNYQARLLDAHLIGRRVRMTADVLDTATLVKVMQLAHGGSGVSSGTYEALLSRCFSAHDSYGAFWDSYGSGDVVPAAWWLVNVLGESAPQQFAPGDLIALLNGTFFSTATAICLLEQVVSIGARLLSRCAMRCSWPVVEQRHPLLVALGGGAPKIKTAIQEPVSLRDLEPIVKALDSAVWILGEAIERRLSAASANPLFVFTSRGVTAHSQNSFLDVTLTMALASVATGIGFVLAALQRLTEHASAVELRRDPRRVEMVQPPKVSQAVLQEALRVAGTSVLTSIGESSGVEDLADGSLAATRQLLELMQRAQEILALDDLVVPTVSRPAQATERAVASALRLRALGHP